MELRTLSKRVVILGTLLIWAVKFLVRPLLAAQHEWNFILGITPNLVGAFLIPFGAYWLYSHTLFFNGMLLRFHFFSDSRIVCLFGFFLLAINEFLQRIPVFGRTFDYYDLLFSAIGLTASYYSFTAMQRRLSL